MFKMTTGEAMLSGESDESKGLGEEKKQNFCKLGD